MSTSLLSLPPELILEIGVFVPPDGILALKLTHHYFNEILPFSPPPKDTPFPECAKLAIRYYLSPPDLEPSHLRCILCKSIYPIGLFRSSSSPACVSDPLEDASQTDVVELPQRLCSWHIGRLARVIHTAPSGRNEWTSHMDNMCMHCGAVQSWGKCGCDCGSCGIRPVRTYTRYLNNDSECRRFVFWRAGMGRSAEQQLMVREECQDPSAKTFINLPVMVEQHDAYHTTGHTCSVSSRPLHVIDALRRPQSVVATQCTAL